MRHERGVQTAGAAGLDRIEALRLTHAEAPAEAILEAVLAAAPDKTAVVSSFGADAAVLLHLVARIDHDLPVLLIDTAMLFPQTLAYQQELAAHLGLRNVQRFTPAAEAVATEDPHGFLHLTDPDRCCDLRKVRPLERALAPWPVVISGRKRFQAGTRAALPVFETDGPRLRVNPLAAWSAAEIAAHLVKHALPRHPLVAHGYSSIGCAPCTSPVAEGENLRAGRWRGTAKVECGIHFGPGGAIRASRRQTGDGHDDARE